MIKQLNHFDDSSALVSALSDQIAADLKQARALFVSGGSTPKALFQALSLRQDIPWAQMTIAAIDERWLSPDHADSNAKLIRDHLLCHHASQARFIPYYKPDCTPEQAALDWHAQISSLLAQSAVMILGMGDDSHTASIFPLLPETQRLLDFQQNALLGACHPKSAPYARLTLSAAAIKQAAKLYLHIQGQNKSRVLAQAQDFAAKNSATGDFSACPIAAFIAQPDLAIHVYASE